MDPRHILPELPPSRGLLVDAGRSSIVQCRTYPKYISSFSQHRHSKCKFSVLRTIVNFLKMRYQEKNTEHYTFEEMTRKAGLLHLDPEVKKLHVLQVAGNLDRVAVQVNLYITAHLMPTSEERNPLYKKTKEQNTPQNACVACGNSEVL
ncbi:hypothetical protein E2C01_020918 [Portunus trituberculatus]|uniref:Uncharacterized protein n=1 Tax=Portunus trituberculatus TaxID=210409 RepID=A0A5B7E2W4_PORTR|nr:hypothetical protein [Portunus trituberculatus]